MQKLFTSRVSSRLVWLLLLALITTHLRAQVYTRRLSNAGSSLAKFGVSDSRQATPSLDLPAVNAAPLLAEDEQQAKEGYPFRFGVSQPANVNLMQASAVSAANGYQVRRYEVHSSGAYSINLVFDQFRLVDGAKLYLYNANHTMLIGPIEASSNADNGVYWTDLISGDRMIVELQEPMQSAGQSQLHLESAVHGYKNTLKNFGDSGNCMINMACQPTYQFEGDGVALILLSNGTRWCTGSLINDIKQSFRSYFLTAFHCVDVGATEGTLTPAEITAAQNWMFRFNYQSPNCTPSQDDATFVTINGATFRSGRAQSDFSLFELTQQAPVAANLTYLGWDRSGAIASNNFGIHHPSGDVKKISFTNANTQVASGTVIGQPGQNFWISFWGNQGVTEGGSSGSPLFDGNRRIIGQLFGGPSFCGATGTALRDFYGRFDISWSAGGSSTTQLKDWLDPANSGGTTTTGVKPVVSGPAAFTGNGSFALNTLDASTTSWSVTGGSGIVSPTSGSGNTAALTALANGTNLTITFTVNAGQSYAIQFTKTFNANVSAPVNTPPVAPAGGIPNQTATVGTLFSYVVPAFTDADAGQTLTYSASGLPSSGLSFNAGTRTISGTPSTSGTIGVTITANDGNGGSTPSSFTITINPAPVVPPTNNPPVAPAIASQTATVGVAYFQNTPSFTDPDAQAISVQAFNLPPGLTYTGTASGIVAGTPTTVGVYSVSLVGTDIGNGTVSGGLSATAVYTITVNPAAPVNNPPVAPAGGIPSQTATVGVAFNYVVPVFTDPDAGQTLTYSATGLPANGLSFTPATRTISGTPSTSGTIGVTITANDGNGGSTPSTFSITINPAPVVPPTNNPPVAPAIASQTATVGVAYFQNTPAFTDPDGQIISIQAFGLPVGLSYSGAPTGIVQGTPTTAGVYSVSLVGTDIGNGTVSGGLSATAVYTITVNPAPVVGGALVLLEPTYNCTTGAFTFNTSGGNGTPVSFSAVGITGPTLNPNQFVDQGLRTAADAPLITLSATQNGVTVTYVWNIRAVCPVGPVTPGSPLTLLAPTYNCATGAFTFNTSGGDGTPITYFAIGITGLTLNPNQLVDQALRNAPDAPPITLSATQSGVTVNYVWNIRAICPLNPVTPGSPLTLTTPTYDCATGAFTFNTSGGDGTPITYFAIGITGATLNPNQFVDEGSRTANDVQPFLLQATQSGVTTTLVWNLKAACGRARVAASEQLASMKVSVLGNPVNGEVVDVEISGAERQPLRIQLSNLQGQLVSELQVKQAGALERVRLQLNRSAGVYLLQVSGPNQTKVVRVLKVN